MPYKDAKMIWGKIGTPLLKVMGTMLSIILLITILTTYTEAASSVIKIGGTLPLSGPAAEDGHRFLEGRKMAVQKINEAGGVLGAKFELVILDDGMDASRVGSLYESLIRKEKLDFLVTSYGAPMTMPAMAIAEKYDKLMISSYSASVGLIEAYGGKRFFAVATQPKDKAYINWWYRGTTDFLWDFDSWNYKPGFPKPKTMVFLGENQLFGIEQSDLWRIHAKKQGWDIVLEEFVDIGQMEFSSIIAKVKRFKPDVINVEFFFFRLIPFAKQMREQGVTANFVIMGESGTRADWPDPKTGAGQLGDRAITFAYLPKTYHEGGADDLRSSFQKKNQRPPGFLEATGYSDIQIIAQAIKLAGSTKTDEVRKALLKGEFQTCYTPVKFNSSGLNERFNPIVGQWVNGELENIYPANVVTAKPVYPFTQ